MSILHITMKPVTTCCYDNQPYGSDIHWLMASFRSSLNPQNSNLEVGQRRAEAIKTLLKTF